MASHAETGAQQRLPESPHIAVIANPASTQSNRLEDKLDLLKSYHYCGPTDIERTLPDGLEANHNKLTRLLSRQDDKKRHDALLVLGGDGTLNLAANFLIRAPGLPEDVRQMPVIAGNGGGINDGHYMMFGHIGKRRLSLRRLGGLPITEISPLNVTTAHEKDGNDENLALLYVSLGFTALVADRVNQPNHRKKPNRGTMDRKFHQTLACVQSLFEVTNFEITEDGRRQRVVEFLATNGSRMAGINLMPGKLTRPEFSRLAAEERRDIIADIGRLLNRNLKWETGYTQTKFTLRPGTNHGRHRPVPMQIDGETLWLPHDTSVQIKTHDQKLRVASTKLDQGRHHI
jgi:diacylglycerol kinase family enzyme